MTEASYIEFISNKINVKLTETESELLFTKLTKLCFQNKIPLNIDFEPTEGLPYMCLLLEENKKLGKEAVDGSMLLIKQLESVSRGDLANLLRKYDHDVFNITHETG